jgi:MFS family permease
MSERPSERLIEHRSFVLFWWVRTSTSAAFMMQGVAVGWQIYELTGSAFDLGLVGLMQFIPLAALGLVVGHVADRFDRRLITGICQAVKALAVAALMAGSLGGWLTREWIFAIMFVTGAARAFEIPTMQALLPSLVPPLILPRAIAASASALQTAIICGPALGGFIYVFGPAAVYGVCAATFMIGGGLTALIRAERSVPHKAPLTLASLFDGFRYIWTHPLLLGAISLDLFVVLLGGLTALLPIYARDILVTGPWGLGLLRSAPAIGALTMSVVLARTALTGHVGRLLFASVGIFALSIIVFALSRSLVLSLVVLAVYGAADAMSVVIRHSLVQLRTPNDMLGRVLATNAMFTGTSGSLGEFRAGSMAAWVGVVGSVLVGGVGALVIAIVWMRLFPQLREVDTLQAPPAGRVGTQGESPR